ncbi:Arc family DNA-binding protein [Paraburkholderia nemoris]|uniref:Arc family DNA-binding protein n=1 Tax=Paraburkholderia nemoris TaxID=2793076 RepID=UPI001F2CCD21|nr:Arc family DNA-binding protein [Paraburkholderia nemoris]
MSNTQMEDTYRSQFRLPYPLYDQLKRAADENRRPLNTELVVRLESTFAPLAPQTYGPDEAAEDLRAALSKVTLAELMTQAEFDALAARFLDALGKRHK